MKHRGSATKLALTMMVLAGLGAVVGIGTWSAFSSTTDTAGNTFSTGTVTLGDNDGGSSLLSLSGAKPDDTDSSCVVVTFSGSLPSSVRLFGATTGTGLDQYLTLKVTRGTIASPTADSCAGFSADATDYIGSGNGVIYSGTLQGYADTYTAGLVDPLPASPETWTNGEAHAYKIDVTVQSNDSAQGKTASQTFTWEARNN